MIKQQIQEIVGDKIQVFTQGKFVAQSLEQYLTRHPEIEEQCTKNGTVQYFTTDSAEKFAKSASIFLREEIVAKRID